MAAMTKFDISHAYPFMSLSFIFVLILSGLLFNEPITIFKIIGLTLIIIGIVIGSQGWKPVAFAFNYKKGRMFNEDPIQQAVFIW